MTTMTAENKPMKLRKSADANRVAQTPNSHIPPMSYFDQHITRTIDGKTEYDVFEYAMEHKRNVLIEGPSGCGKTSASIAFSAMKGLPFYSISSNAGIDPSQLFGRYIPDEVNGGFMWVDGAVTSIVRNGGVLLINEVNFMPERISTVLFGLLDKRREITLMDHKSETIKAHDDVLVVADMNPGYEGTRPLNKAFRNRFAIQQVWDYDRAVEMKLVESPSLLTLASDIRRRSVSGEFETPFGTNMLIEFEEIAKDMGYEFSVQNTVNHFTDTERDSIKLLYKTNATAIKTELGLMNAPKRTANIADTGDIESKYPAEHPIWDKRRSMKMGEIDEELGIKGVEWEL